MTATCPLEHFLAQSAVDKVNPQDGGIEKVGLDKMPDKWYEQAQLVLWPMDTPTDPFQHHFLTCTHGITMHMLSWWEYMPSSCGLAQATLSPDKAAAMAQNFKDGGHIKVLAQVLWDWQAERNLPQIHLLSTVFVFVFMFEGYSHLVSLILR